MASAAAEVRAFLVRDVLLNFSVGESPLFGPDVLEKEVSVTIRRDGIIASTSLDQSGGGGGGTDKILGVMLDSLIFSPALARKVAGDGALAAVDQKELSVIITFSKLASGISITLKGDVLEDLVFLFGTDHVQLLVTLSEFQLTSADAQVGGTLEYSIETTPEIVDGAMIFSSAEPSSLLAWKNELFGAFRHKNPPVFSTKLSVLLKTSPEQCQDPLLVNKKLLQDGYKSDMSIVLENDQVLLCHQFFLSAYSEVLSDLTKQAVDHDRQLEMKDLNEETARAMLAYLYYRDEETAYENMAIALDLLAAANTYSIRGLEESMEAILLVKPNHSFPVAEAFRLFFSAFDIPEWSDLKEKAIAVMKLKSKELIELDEYQNLFAAKPTEARNLCNALVVN